MQKLSEGMLLYHGSYVEVIEPDISKCAAKKDFGKGFYLTTSKEQAESFVSASIKKAAAQGIVAENQAFGFVSTFEYHEKEELSEHVFEKVDKDWLHCVVGHRKSNTFESIVEELKSYDIVAGKIADDRTNVVITTYLIGGYGSVGSVNADEICMAQLIPERLSDQYCFRTDAALSCISFVESEKVWIK